MPFSHALYSSLHIYNLNPIQDGSFWGCSEMWGEVQKGTLPKICYTYPAMIKLGTIIPELKKVQ